MEYPDIWGQPPPLLALVVLATSACSGKSGIKGNSVDYEVFSEWYTKNVVEADSGNTKIIEADVNADV